MSNYSNIIYPILLFLAFGMIILLLVKYLNMYKSWKLLLKLSTSAEKLKSGEIDIQKDLDNYLNVEDMPRSPETETLRNSLKSLLNELAAGIDNTIRNQILVEENEKLKVSNSAQTRFFSNMSHEIRTPMNSILGISQILLYDDNLTEAQMKYVEEIKQASDSLLMIMNDILDLSKLETGDFPINDDDFNYNLMIENVVSSAHFAATKKNIEFKYIVEGNPPNALFGDETHIRKVLSNLLANAVKYTKKGRIVFRVQIQENDIIYTIEDTGIGIPPDKIEKIFIPFENYEPVPGYPAWTGLGLPIVGKLIELMGAKIDLKSQPGLGTVFTVTFPKVIGDESKIIADVSNSEVSAQKASILIVDDNEINLHVASGLIETFFKADCDLAFSGKEALEKIQETSYDLVFMDHMMPEMDGIQTTTAIRSLGAKYKKLPIIALTANAVIGTKEELIKGGMNDFLSKPIQKKDLYNILGKWLPKDKININEILFNDETENTPSNSFFESLSNVRGLDIRQALQNVANREDVLENSLRLLFAKIPSQVAELRTLLDVRDLRRFSLLTHTIKGSFSNCGFMLLSKLASKLSRESEVENFAYCRENLSFFIEKLGDVATELSNIFNSPVNSDEKVKGSLEDLEKIKDKLIDTMEDYNYYAIVALVEKLKEADYGDDKNETIALLDEKIKFYDYNGSKEIIYSL